KTIRKYHTKNHGRGEYKERSTDGKKVQKIPGKSAGDLCIRDSSEGEGADLLPRSNTEVNQ
ncbi:hypothetical protein, partial [Serratia sp. (in: enterobacteria)]|uniref:hypothetical protein n=1 Tax=Serratia sp. (in: enterobacteria) TaxID=616 RepID=UPI003989DF7C